jgi:hypothetical protein
MGYYIDTAEAVEEMEDNKKREDLKKKLETSLLALFEEERKLKIHLDALKEVSVSPNFPLTTGWKPQRSQRMLQTEKSRIREKNPQ